jgi:hypothetical protein
LKTEFNFERPLLYKETEKLTASEKYKYAISLWYISKGGSSIQFYEYGFDKTPHEEKFHLS